MLILSTFLISGCSSVRQLDVFKTEVERQPLELPAPLTPKLEELKWTIITSDNAEEVFTKMKEQGLDPVIFGLSDKHFQLIAKNFAQIRAHLKHTNDLLEQYKEYYEPEEKKEEK